MVRGKKFVRSPKTINPSGFLALFDRFYIGFFSGQNEVILGWFWTIFWLLRGHLGIILPMFLASFRGCFDPIWLYFGPFSAFSTFFPPLMSIFFLGGGVNGHFAVFVSMRGYFGVTSGSPWDHFGVILGRFGVDLVSI